MPSSQYYQINEIMDLIVRLNPHKMLDIGPGFGKYGFLCREYLELWDGRNVYGNWLRRIDCIEAFDKYLTPVHHNIYSSVYTGNALDILPGIQEHYDLVLMVDVFEHFSFEDGRRLMRSCLEKADHVLIATPKSVNTQEEVFDNEFEQHRFEWKRSHFKEYGNLFFAPHHSTLICLVGKEAPSIGLAYRKNRLRLYMKRHFRFLRILNKLFN